MPRVTKEIAHQLIQVVKKIDVRLNYWDGKSRNSLEFARQMMSPKLKKTNASYDCVLELHDDDEPPTVKAEFMDGTKWAFISEGFKASEIRNELYAKAEEIEEVMERTSGKAGDDGADNAKKGGKGGKK